MTREAESTYQLTPAGHEVRLLVSGHDSIFPDKEAWLFFIRDEKQWWAIRRQTSYIENVNEGKSPAAWSKA